METDRNTKGNARKKWQLAVLIFLTILCLFIIFTMAINSRKPDRITLGNMDMDIKGGAFIRSNQILIKQLYMNWLPNDLFWPTVLLDNMPNFQRGELEVVRYNMRVLRDNLSRMRTTDKLDPLAESAFSALSNDPLKWWFPSAESKWKAAHKDLGIIYQNLSTGKSHFYPRADNLAELLNQYASLMGGANTRLINAPPDIKETPAMEAETEDSPSGKKMVDINIPWNKIDDNFYYGQGIAYALHESFKAIRIDFIDILKDKNSLNLVDKIIEDLRRCDFEPMIVFNGDLGSVFANHSLNLSGVFNDARQKVNSLIVSLKIG